MGKKSFPKKRAAPAPAGNANMIPLGSRMPVRRQRQRSFSPVEPPHWAPGGESGDASSSYAAGLGVSGARSGASFAGGSGARSGAPFVGGSERTASKRGATSSVERSDSRSAAPQKQRSMAYDRDGGAGKSRSSAPGRYDRDNVSESLLFPSGAMQTSLLSSIACRSAPQKMIAFVRGPTQTEPPPAPFGDAASQSQSRAPTISYSQKQAPIISQAHQFGAAASAENQRSFPGGGGGRSAQTAPENGSRSGAAVAVVKQKPLRGLPSIENETSYFNVVVQVARRLSARRWLKTARHLHLHTARCRRDACLHCSVGRLIWDDMHLSGHQLDRTYQQALEVLPVLNASFINGPKLDIIDYVSALLGIDKQMQSEGADEALKPIDSKDGGKLKLPGDSVAKAWSELGSRAESRCLIRVSCGNCFRSLSKVQTITKYHVHLNKMNQPSVANVKDLFEEEFKTRILPEVACPECQARGTFEEQKLMLEWPEFLLIAVNRFNEAGAKDETYVPFSVNLSFSDDMKNDVSNEVEKMNISSNLKASQQQQKAPNKATMSSKDAPENVTYSLDSLVTHSGEKRETGRYSVVVVSKQTTHRNQNENVFYEINDDQIKSVAAAAVFKLKPTLLVYKLRDADQEQADEKIIDISEKKQGKQIQDSSEQMQGKVVSDDSSELLPELSDFFEIKPSAEAFAIHKSIFGAYPHEREAGSIWGEPPTDTPSKMDDTATDKQMSPKMDTTPAADPAAAAAKEPAKEPVAGTFLKFEKANFIPERVSGLPDVGKSQYFSVIVQVLRAITGRYSSESKLSEETEQKRKWLWEHYQHCAVRNECIHCSLGRLVYATVRADEVEKLCSRSIELLAAMSGVFAAGQPCDPVLCLEKLLTLADPSSSYLDGLLRTGGSTAHQIWSSLAQRASLPIQNRMQCRNCPWQESSVVDCSVIQLLTKGGWLSQQTVQDLIFAECDPHLVNEKRCPQCRCVGCVQIQRAFPAHPKFLIVVVYGTVNRFDPQVRFQPTVTLPDRSGGGHVPPSTYLLNAAIVANRECVGEYMAIVHDASTGQCYDVNGADVRSVPADSIFGSSPFMFVYHRQTTAPQNAPLLPPPLPFIGAPLAPPPMPPLFSSGLPPFPIATTTNPLPPPPLFQLPPNFPAFIPAPAGQQFPVASAANQPPPGGGDAALMQALLAVNLTSEMLSEVAESSSSQTLNKESLLYRFNVGSESQPAFNFGSWNIDGCSTPQDEVVLKESLAKHKVLVAGLQSCDTNRNAWEAGEELRALRDEYDLIWDRGGDERRPSTVGFLVHKDVQVDLSKSLDYWGGCLTLLVKIGRFEIYIINCLGPSRLDGRAMLKEFYKDLKLAVEEAPPGALVLICGDFDGNVARHGRIDTIGEFPFHNNADRNGEALMAFSLDTKFAIANTFFGDQPPGSGRGLFTWSSGSLVAQVSYFLAPMKLFKHIPMCRAQTVAKNPSKHSLLTITVSLSGPQKQIGSSGQRAGNEQSGAGGHELDQDDVFDNVMDSVISSWMSSGDHI